jgi:hypothetical protein
MTASSATSSFMQPRAKDLSIFALQIARGMAHVASCGVSKIITFYFNDYVNPTSVTTELFKEPLKYVLNIVTILYLMETDKLKVNVKLM